MKNAIDTVAEVISEIFDNLPVAFQKMEEELENNPEGQMAKNLKIILKNQEEYLKRHKEKR
jgi:hypothetical protein